MGISFSKYTINTSFNTPTGIIFSDLDKDSLPDLVAISSGFSGDDLIWHQSFSGNNGISTIANLVDGELKGTHNALVSADLDKDGDMDLITAENEDDDVVIWYNGGQSTTWTSKKISDDFGGATKLFIADFGGDGWLDIVGVSEDDDDVSIWRQTGQNTFAGELVLDGNFNEARAVDGGDFNRDGRPDVVAGGQAGLFWYRNTSNGTGWAKNVIDMTYQPQDIKVADIDKDNDLDIIIAADNGVYYWSNANGFFFGPVQVANFKVAQIAVADIDRDGDNDLIFGNNSTGASLYWYANNGSGTFTANTISNVNLNTITAVGVGDANNDGFTDIAIGTDGEDDIYWYRNELRLASVTANANPVEAGANGTFTISLDEAALAATTVNYTVSGTATKSTDYNTLSGSVTIAKGASSATVTLTPINDLNYDPGETVTITLTGNGVDNNYAVNSTKSSATLTITDPNPVISVSSSGSISPTEAGVRGQFTISLNSNATSNFNIAYSLSGSSGDIILDNDTNPNNGNLGTNIPIGIGEKTKTIYVFAQDDFTYEGNESFTFTLLPATPVVNNIASGTGYRVDLNKKSLTLNIADNEPTVTVSTVKNLQEGSNTGEFIGYVDITLDQVVTKQPGLYVYYSITGGTATQFTDYLNSQGRLTSGSSVQNMVFIPKGAKSARLYLSALPDAIAESNETITIALIADQSPNTTPNYAVGNSYALGSAITATVNITDSGYYLPNIAILDRYGNAVTETNPLEANSNGTVNFGLKLTSQPTQDVTVSVDTVTLTFTPTNWDILQNVTLNDITSTHILPVSSTSTDSKYQSLASDLTINPDDGIPELEVTEGENPLPTIIPSASILWVSDAKEGSQLGGSFQLLLSHPAPEEGLTIRYQVTGTATANGDYPTLSGVINVNAGATSAFLNIPVIDDWVKENSETVIVSLQTGEGYTVNSATGNATLTISDDDQSGIAFASPQTTASVTTTSDLLSVSVITFENNSGSFTVALTRQPTANVTVKLSDGLNNNATAEVLTFTPQNWQSAQNVTLTNLTASNSSDFNYQLVAITESSDSNYQNQTVDFPIVTNLLNTSINSVLTTEGETEVLQLKLTSQPLSDVTLSFSQIDATENGFSTTSLTFTPDNWNRYQSINITGLTDDRADGDVTYNVKVTATSSDNTYNGVSQLLPITNRDIDSDVINNEVEKDDNLAIDPLVTLSIQGSSTISESSTTGGKFRITVGEGSSSEPVKVRYSVVTHVNENNATEGIDYQSFNFFERQLGGKNPFNGFDVGSYSAPTLVDLDQDGDLDLAIGTYEGTIVYYQNTGTNNQPIFTKVTVNNPFGNIDLNGSTAPGHSTPTFADIDGDNDPDLVLGGNDGTLHFYRNSNLNFTEVTGAENPFSTIDVGDYSAPILVDLDSDGDLDLFIGNGDGLIKFYRNVGSETNPVFVEDAAGNPFNNLDLGDRAGVTFADLDDDGDLDAVLMADTNGSTKSDGAMQYWLNIGTPAQPNFVQDNTLLERSNFTIPDNPRPAFGDINGDLDQDLLLGNLDGIIGYYDNLSSGEVTIAPGQFADIDLTPFTDNIAEGNETINVVLNTNQGYYIDPTKTTVTFTLQDDDTAGVSITDSSGNAVNGQTYSTSEGDSSPLTFQAKLTSQPTDNVIVYLGTNNQNEGILSAEFQDNQSVVSLYFTPENWNIEQSFTVHPQEDLRDDGTVNYQIISTVISGDDFYNDLAVSDIAFSNQDNDSAGINVTQIAGDSGEGTTNSYQISLKTQPLAPVQVTMTPSNEEIKFANQGFSQPLTLIFDAQNWDIPQVITVFAVDDTQIEYNHNTAINFALSSEDNSYHNLTPPQPVQVNIRDNDLPLATLSVTQNATEEAMPGYFTISLSEAVNSAFGSTGVNIAYRVLGSSSAVNGTDYQSVLETGTVRIAPGQTSTTLAIAAIDNFIDNGDKQVVIELLAGDGYSLGESVTNTLVITNNDKAGVQIIQSGIVPVVKEGGDYTFYVSLLSEPTAKTTVNFTDTPKELNSVSPIEFVSSNWYIPKSVTISAIDDNVAETGENHTTQLAFSFTGAPEYQNLSQPVTMAVNVIDRTFDSVDTALGLQYSLNSLERALTESVLPLIGNASQLPSFFDEITNKIVSEVYTTNNLTAWKLEQIFKNLLSETLGSSLSNLQVNYTPNSSDTPFTVSFTVTYNDQTLALAKNLAIPSLDLTVNGNAQADISYDFNLGFGINKNGGYYLNTNQTVLNPHIQLDNVTLAGTDSINSLTVDFLDKGIDLDLDYDVKALGSNLNTEALKSLKNLPTQDLFAQFDYAFKEGSFAKLALSAVPDEKIIDLFPGLTFDLDVPELPLYNYADTAKSHLNDFVVNLQNVTLDVQSLVRGYLKEYVDWIDEILQPFYPILDALNKDTKFLSTLGLDPLFDKNHDGKVSVMEMALAVLKTEDSGGTKGRLDFYKFIDAINELVDLVKLVDDYLADDNSLPITIGSSTTAVQNGELGFSLDDLTIPDGNILDRIASNPLASNDLNELLERLLALDGFQLPLLTDFASVAGFLLGQENIKFLIYDVPDVDFKVNMEFPQLLLNAILPDWDFNCILEVALGLNSNLYFAYDDYGLNQWQKSNFDPNQLNLLLDGLYLRDVDENGKDVNELGASFGIGIGLEANIIVAKARMTGGVQSDNDVKLDAVDGGEYQGLGDGLIRFSEIAPLFTGDLSVLEISGAAEAFLNTKIKVGIDVGLFEIMKTILDIDLKTFKLWDAEDILKQFGLSGFASQSYLQGATVFFDANFNAQLDEGEVSATSNDEGSFNLSVGLVPFDRNRNGKIDDQDGRLVVIDGVDTATGLPISTPLFAPVNSSMITPLTSLVQKLQQTGIDLALAETKIKQIFGLPADLNLSTFNPIAALENGDINGKKVYTSHVITQSAIAVLTQLVSGVTGQNPAQVTDLVIEAIALSLYNEENGSFQNVSFLDNLVTNLVNRVDVEFSTEQLSEVTNILTKILSAGTRLIATTVEESSPEDLIANLKALKTDLQFNLANVLGKLGSGLMSPTEVNQAIDQLLSNGQGSFPSDLNLTVTSVNKNVPANHLVGTLTTTDADTGDTFTYTLVAGNGDNDNGTFAIINDQLLINQSPDFETQSRYNIRIQTVDQNGLSFEKALTITVNDLNETTDNQAPTDLAISATTVDENVPANSVIGTLTSTDADTGDTFTYRLVTGTGDNDNGTFAIINDQLLINQLPDFETQSRYNIRIQTVDQNGLSFEKALTITVNDLNEIPSVLTVRDLLTEIPEDADTTEDIKVADLLLEDDALGKNTFFLTGQDKDRFLIRDLALYYVGGTFNFEAQNSYEVTVNVDDETVGTTPDLTQTFTLKITDVNEAPTAIILTNTTKVVAENTDTSQGIKVADIQITDDALGTNTLSVLGNDQSRFEIRGQELFFIGKADFEAQELYDLTVAVTDTTLKPTANATPDATVNFTLEVTNLPDQPVSPETLQFKGSSNGQGSLVLNFSNLPGLVQVKANEDALKQTGAFFNNVVGLYKVANDNGAVLDTLDLDGDGNTQELIQPGAEGYARTALSQAVKNFILQASGEGGQSSTTAAEFGDVLLEGGQRYAPFVIANGGNLGGSLKESIQAFLAKNPDNTGATLENFMSHEVAYFSFGAANPDGAEHLQARGNNTFGFEDLPGNLPNISDNDFNDGILAFSFMG